MCDVIDFATRRSNPTAPKVETECDWTIESAPVAGFADMVQITLVADRSALAEIKAHHEATWARHVMGQLASAKAERAG
ncbi:hypothetical protein FJ420_17080 [Mesorhizobium sp. B3-1-3]|uniref:hypothetical protein n=1 Tax=unclassified Mesorhizobium TaxID=325217 RepID=UPI00112604B0|nr:MULTISPECIES: hypothetical protein [unclassified Mesorhizobium]TPI64274.1 hypothetical protein FJ424_18080 [Mesorhizobium sp. B3-1-8]TPI70246.1 hypothetical protein FJ420_17080 [Mesorhizobium sp. B3-1-3]